MNKNEMKDILLVSQGKKKCDLVIKNATYLNVFTNSWIKANLGIYHGIFIGEGDYEGITEIDYYGKYLIPSFIDSHVHIESSLGTPEIFAKEILPFGTTTIIADPHEIANVAGLDGLHYMFDSTENLPINVFIMLPSCVPASIFETSGAKLNAKDLQQFINNPRCLGLGEVMDNNYFKNLDDDMLEKLLNHRFKIIDGHAPSLNGYDLNSYRLTGVQNDHECSFEEEVINKIKCGFNILAREGSACKNSLEIIKTILKNHIPFSNVAFCSDDKHISDIRKSGHISYNVNLAIKIGVPIIEAIKMASYYPSTMLKLKNIGAIAPGYEASFITIPSQQKIEVEDVYFKGKKVVKNKKLIIDIPNFPIPSLLKNTIYLPDLKSSDMVLKFTQNKIPVINLIPGEILTSISYFIPENNLFNYEKGIKKIAVFGRHKNNFSNKTIALIKGYEINGAIASSVTHDSHNIIVIGSNDEDMVLAVNELKKIGGGYILVENKKVVATVNLPICGILSDNDPEILHNCTENLIKKAHQMGVSNLLDVLQPLSFSGLSVIPEIRITDLGVIHVLNRNKMLI